jgi:hypothetical protein
LHHYALRAGYSGVQYVAYRLQLLTMTSFSSGEIRIGYTSLKVGSCTLQGTNLLFTSPAFGTHLAERGGEGQVHQVPRKGAKRVGKGEVTEPSLGMTWIRRAYHVVMIPCDPLDNYNSINTVRPVLPDTGPMSGRNPLAPFPGEIQPEA